MDCCDSLVRYVRKVDYFEGTDFTTVGVPEIWEDAIFGEASNVEASVFFMDVFNFINEFVV